MLDPLLHDINRIKKEEDSNIQISKTEDIYRMRKIPGMTLFQYNKKTGVLSTCVTDETNVSLKPEGTETGPLFPANKILTEHVVKEKKDNIYFQKLNFKNAVKLLMKRGFSKIKIYK